MAELLRARDFQSPDDATRQYAESREPDVAASLYGAFDDLQRAVDVAVIAKLLSELRYVDVISAVPLDAFQRTLVAIEQELNQISVDLGRARLAELNRLGFADADTSLLQPTTAYRQTILSDVAASTRETIRKIINDGMRDGAPPRAMAQEIYETIGLSPRQAQAVTNFRRALERQDTEALRRALRDPAFDARLSEALRSGKPLSAAEINRMVAAYADNYRGYRALSIARTQTLAAANRGVRQAYVSAVNSGDLLASAVRRFWLIAGDEHVCMFCRAVPLLNREGVPLGVPYAVPGGFIAGPDESHPQCRCTEHYEIATAAVRNPIAA